MGFRTEKDVLTESPSAQPGEYYWRPRLNKVDKEAIARAVGSHFNRVARGLGFEIFDDGIKNKPDPPSTFYFPDTRLDEPLPPIPPNFILLIRVNPYIDLEQLKGTLTKAGFPIWFIDSLVDQYVHQISRIAHGKSRESGSWREWIVSLQKLPGSLVWGYLTLSEYRREQWIQRLKRSGRSANDLRLSKDAAITITALLFEKARISSYIRAVESLRKLFQRTPSTRRSSEPTK